MNILIVEDEILISEMLKEMLLELGHKVIAQVTDYDETVHYLKHFPEINFVFCDINLNSNKTGIDIGRVIQKKYGCQFVYLTSYSDDLTLNSASETEPSAYLIKPFSKKEIKATLVMAKVKSIKNDKFIVFKDGHDHVRLKSNDILYVQSDNNYITVHTHSKKYVIRNSLERFVNELDCECLVRVHRSFAVNLREVDAVCNSSLSIGDCKIPLSRKYKEQVKSQYTLLSV